MRRASGSDRARAAPAVAEASVGWRLDVTTGDLSLVLWYPEEAPGCSVQVTAHACAPVLHGTWLLLSVRHTAGCGMFPLQMPSPALASSMLGSYLLTFIFVFDALAWLRWCQTEMSPRGYAFAA